MLKERDKKKAAEVPAPAAAHARRRRLDRARAGRPRDPRDALDRAARGRGALPALPVQAWIHRRVRLSRATRTLYQPNATDAPCAPRHARTHARVQQQSFLTIVTIVPLAA